MGWEHVEVELSLCHGCRTHLPVAGAVEYLQCLLSSHELWQDQQVVLVIAGSKMQVHPIEVLGERQHRFDMPVGEHPGEPGRSAG